MGAITTYYAAGLFGGVVLGLIWPLTQSGLGTALVGVVAGLIIFFFVAISRDGPFWRWDGDVWEGVGVVGVLFGLVCAFIWRKVLKQ